MSDHPCNLCGEPWPSHAAACSYAVTAAENVRLRQALDALVYVHSDGSACHHSESERRRRGCAAAIAVSPPAAEEEIVRLRQALQRCWDHGQTGGAIRKIVDEALGRNENG